MKNKNAVCLLVVIVIAGFANAAISDFENLTLAPESHWSGTYPYVDVDPADGYADDSSETVAFQSGSAGFINTSGYSWSYPFWDGWAYSNKTDTTTPGFTNQYSAIAGGGFDGSDNYGVSFMSYATNTSTITLAQNSIVTGAYFTNTTYAYLAMLNGEGPATAFGQDDWLKVTITGKNAQGGTTGSIDFLLADGTDIMDEWTWVDMTVLGVVAGLEFSMTSTDNGDYGMNTPGYFAMDNLSTVVPEPATMVLLGLGGLLLRRKQS